MNIIITNLYFIYVNLLGGAWEGSYTVFDHLGGPEVSVVAGPKISVNGPGPVRCMSPATGFSLLIFN